MVSLISSLRYFTFLYGHTKHHIHNREGGRKENIQTRTWVSLKRKNGEVFGTFTLLSVHLWASASVYSSEIPTKPLFSSLRDISSFDLFQSRGKSLGQVLCVGFVPKQTKGSSDWHPHQHPQKRMPPIVSQVYYRWRYPQRIFGLECCSLKTLKKCQQAKNLSWIGIILRWGFLIWELIFIYCGLFVLILVVFVLFLLSLCFGQISPLVFFRWLPWPRIGMVSLVTVSPVITLP